MQQWWQVLSVSPRTAPSDGAQVCTYVRRSAVDRHDSQQVIGLRLPNKIVNRFLRFHGLPSGCAQRTLVLQETSCTWCLSVQL